MTNALAVIEKALTAEPALVKIKLALEQDEAKAMKYMANVLSVVSKAGSYLQSATPESFIDCALESINIELEIDSRQLCYIVPYKNKNTGKVQASLQVGWRGYIHKIKKYNPTCDIQVGLVYVGDAFEKYSESGVAKYRHKPKVENCFENDPAKLVGAYCYISYSVDRQPKAVCETIGKKEIELIKSKNPMKDKNVWDEWYNEMAKKSVIKKACKLHFAGAVHELDQYDNKNYDLEKGKPTNKADVWNEPQKQPGDDAEDITPPDASITDKEKPKAKQEVKPKSDAKTDKEKEGDNWSITIEGKEKGFETLTNAVNYLVKVMGNHKTKVSRVKLLMENEHLVFACTKHREEALSKKMSDCVQAGAEEEVVNNG